jgi:hypothetical protein
MFYQFKNLKQRIPFPFIDVYLFRWRNLTPSGIHDHAEKGCYLWLIKGELKEDIYTREKQLKHTNIHTAPSVTYINNTIGLHCVQPLKNSLSLHFYYPKGHKTKYYKSN